ncbi:MAG: DegV family protein [Bacilli bacterium]|nr:DegV family protein [Bacilli bacterium]
MIRILVDSASDILKNNSDHIAVVPLSVNINNHVYLDGVDLGHDQFYKMLEEVEEFPKTSQPSPQSFVEEFEKVKEAGDELICIMLSSSISGTYQSAVLAKSIVDYDKIYIVDSLSAIYGVKILVEEAKKCIEQGLAVQEIIDRLEILKSRIQIFLSVDTLEYLYKGGRLDRTSTIIGGIAKVKPIIELNREGKINVVSKAIGMVRAMNSIIDLVNNKGIDTNYPFYTLYSSGTKNIEKLEAKLVSNNISFNDRDEIGPVIGTHVGPEAFGVVFVTKE